MAARGISPAVPDHIRTICDEWNSIRNEWNPALNNKTTMKLVADGRTDYYLVDLLCEVICCLNSFTFSPKHEADLRTVQDWILSMVTEWAIDLHRGSILDKSNDLEQG